MSRAISHIVLPEEQPPISWAAWRQALRRLGRNNDARNRAIKTTAIKTWHDYHERWYAPEIALLDVMTDGCWWQTLSGR